MIGARLLACAALVLGGCATPPDLPTPYDRVVVLPDPDGRVGQVTVTRNNTTAELADAYASVRVDEQGRVEQAAADPDAVRRDFASTLDALPPRPVIHTVYFVRDSDELTPESSAQGQAILAEIARRPVADIVIIGHTDRVGELEYNDQLSLRRAAAVRSQLIALGGDPARISIAGRGEREPVIETADEVPEPRNRRAQLDVR